ncbi:MAG: hypothetical protein IJX17_07245, partial [Clostridia bacterium]|nr:hypothetical protein [Clostridia bacterium]
MKRIGSLFLILVFCLFSSTMLVGCKKGKELTADMISLSSTSFVYDGTEKKPDVTIKVKKDVIDAKYYTVEYSDNINVGEASVTVTTTKKNKKIRGSATVKFEITSAEFSGEFSSISNAVYNAQNQFPEIIIEGYTENTDYTLSFSYKKIGADDNSLVSVTSDDFVDAGVYTITATGIGNYSGTKTTTYTIEKANYDGLTVSRVAYSYTETPTNFSLSQDVFGEVKYYYSIVEDMSSAKEFDIHTILDAGKYYFYAEISESDNYNSCKTTTSSFIVSTFDLVGATITLAENSYDYTGVALNPKPLVVCGNYTLVENEDYTLSYENNTNIGTASIKVIGKGNFAGEVVKTFEIVASSKPCSKHTEKAPVIENIVKATVGNDGSYDSVVYCDICGTEISRTPNKINKI